MKKRLKTAQQKPKSLQQRNRPKNKEISVSRGRTVLEEVTVRSFVISIWREDGDGENNRWLRQSRCTLRPNPAQFGLLGDRRAQRPLADSPYSAQVPS